MSKEYCLTNERDLLTATAAGDQSAFCKLYEYYYPLLATHIHRITRSHETTEEILQDIFLKIWLNRSELDNIVHFKSYLGAMSRNAAINALRNLHRREARHRVWESQQTVAADTASDIETHERQHRSLEEAIERLPPQQRNVYLMASRRELKYAEIADEMNLTRNTVKRYLQLARMAIAKYLHSGMSGLPICLLAHLFF